MMQTMAFQVNVFGLVIDLSEVVTDGTRWYGDVTIKGLKDATAFWSGVDGSDFGELVGFQGDAELCRFVERQGGEIESAITDLLGDPCDDEGRVERARALAIEAAIDDRMVAA